MKKKLKIVFENIVSVRIDDPSNEIIQKFLDWRLKSDVYALNLGGTSGGGIYRGFYTQENADKIKIFLSSL